MFMYDGHSLIITLMTQNITVFIHTFISVITRYYTYTYTDDLTKIYHVKIELHFYNKETLNFYKKYIYNSNNPSYTRRKKKSILCMVVLFI